LHGLALQKGSGWAGCAIKKLASELESSSRQPVPADPARASTSRARVSNHHPIDEDLSLGAPAHTQTPGATPRKDSRIPESTPRVNEKPNARTNRAASATVPRRQNRRPSSKAVAHLWGGTLFGREEAPWMAGARSCNSVSEAILHKKLRSL